MNFRKFFRFVVLFVVFASVRAVTEDVPVTDILTDSAILGKPHKYEGVVVKDSRVLAPAPASAAPCKSPGYPGGCGCGCGCSHRPQPEAPKPCPCLAVPKDFCNQAATVPLYRYYNKKGLDHYFTTEVDDDKKKNHEDFVVYEGVAGRCYANAEDGTIPLYWYYNYETVDHFYTSEWSELEAASYGYYFKGILCYISPVARKGTLALLRYWSAKRTDHFYTTDSDEIGGWNKHWVSEKIPGWICPRKASDAPIAPCAGSLHDHEQESEQPFAIEENVVVVKP